MKRNNSIDLLRFVCAMLVVVIHTSPFDFINETVTYIVVQILPRIAVPFFFCVSGYYFICKLEVGEQQTLKYIFRVLKVYAFWSCIYFVRDIYVAMRNSNVNVVSMVKGFIVKLCIYGSNYHFWFFVALIFATCIVALAYKLRVQKLLAFLSIGLYLVGLLGGSYYGLGKQIPVLNMFIEQENFEWWRRLFFMGVPFFVLGYFVRHFEKSETNKGALIKTCLFGTLFVMEIVFVNVMTVQRNIVTTVFLYVFCMYLMILLLKNPLEKYGKVASKSRLLANYTFYVHPLIIWGLDNFMQWNNTILFVLTCIICVVSGYALIRINNKFIRAMMG